MPTDWNSVEDTMPRAANRKQVQMIRRAETPADYFATFDCFEVGRGLLGSRMP